MVRGETGVGGGCRLVERHPVGQRDDESFKDDDLVREPAVLRCSRTFDGRGNDDLLAHGELGDLGSHGEDGASDLVTERDRPEREQRRQRTVEKPDVAVAEPGGADVHDEFVRGGYGCRHLAQGEGLPTSVNCHARIVCSLNACVPAGGRCGGLVVRGPPGTILAPRPKILHRARFTTLGR